jgi:hypothetical protein
MPWPSAEYWHIGAMAMRFASSRGPKAMGEKSMLMETPVQVKTVV